MALIHRLLFHAAQRLATDQRVKEKAAELIETEVKPRVRDAWKQAKPRIDAAKSDLAQIASETDPREKPKEGIVRLNGLDLQNLQLRTFRLQVAAIRPGRRPGLA